MIIMYQFDTSIRTFWAVRFPLILHLQLQNPLSDQEEVFSEYVLFRGSGSFRGLFYDELLNKQ